MDRARDAPVEVAAGLDRREVPRKHVAAALRAGSGAARIAACLRWPAQLPRARRRCQSSRTVYRQSECTWSVVRSLAIAAPGSDALSADCMMAPRRAALVGSRAGLSQAGSVHASLIACAPAASSRRVSDERINIKRRKMALLLGPQRRQSATSQQ